MINIKNQIPGIYYDASRDFQILGHLYEVALNYTKTNADMLYLLPNNIEADTRATELLAMTLGFKLRRNYDKAQLAALVSIFPRLLKIKGTLQAIELAGNALVKASGVAGAFTCELENHILTIKIPIELSDITLFIDLLPYILPFGIRVSIIRSTVLTRTAISPVGATAVMRKALPSMFTDHEHFVSHPLGLTKISEDNGHLTVDYSNSNFIDSRDNTAIPGLFGATPIIDFAPDDTLSVKIEINEENG